MIKFKLVSTTPFDFDGLPELAFQAAPRIGETIQYQNTEYKVVNVIHAVDAPTAGDLVVTKNRNASNE